MDNLIGKQLGDYTIIERIGQGGSAVVYRAEQPSMKREVALKVINVIEASEHGDFFRRFEKEAALIASLEHVRILPVHSYGIEGNWAYMAMRLLRGGTLKDIMREGRLPLTRSLKIFEQVANGLAYAHSKGIVHRDLKPGNIMLDEDGNAYLTDFGLAKMIQGNDSTQSGSIVGTIANMAPEQLRGEPIDHRADIYGMGTILYELAVGTTPYTHERNADIVSLIYQHLEENPKRPSQHDPGIPPELEKTIMKAIAKRPDQRFDSVSEMLESLETLMGTASITVMGLPDVDRTLIQRARETDSTIAAQSRIRRLGKNPLVISVILIVIVLGLFGGVLLANAAIGAAIEPTATPTNTPTSTPSPTPTDLPTPTDIPLPTILTGITGTGADIEPDSDRIIAAHTKLGDDGFIAIIACNLSSEYHATLNREIRSFLLAYRLDSRVYNSDNDAYDQIPIIEQAMAEGASGIILCPLDVTLLEASLQNIEDNNLPVVALARTESRSGAVQLSSETDNYSMGYTVGQFAGELINEEMDGQAKVVILDFPDLDIIVERANGLEDGVLSIAEDSEIVGRYVGAFSENGQESIENLLEDEIAFDVILSINDAGSYGAIDALEAADITPDEVMVLSIDAERKALDYMREGRFIRGTLSVGRQESARVAADIMTQLLSGAEVPEYIWVQSGDMVTPEPVDSDSD